MFAYFAELVRAHELLYVFTWRDIKIKYQQSLMGVLWALFMPMIIVGAGILVRYALEQKTGGALDPQQVATVSVKAVAWAFFVSALRFGTNSLAGNSNLVTKIKFPKAVFPMAAVLSAFFDFVVATIVVAVLLALVGLHVDAHLLWAPVLVFVLTLLVVGLTSLLAVANLFFRDVKYIVEVIVTFAIFFTPVFYDASAMGKWAKYMMLNPVAPILEGLSATVVHAQNPQLIWVAYSAGLGLALVLASWYAFSTLEPRFAENI